MANTPLTPENLEKLLSYLNPDREVAGQEFELLWLKMREYFRARGCVCTEDLADEAMNRLARKIAEGEDIRDVLRYSYGLARLIWLEYLRKPDTNHVPLDELPVLSFLPTDLLLEKQKEQCYLHCLQQLPEEERALIIEYWDHDGQSHHEARKELAERLGISLVALRIRVTRIKKKLESCLATCLEQGLPKVK
ncbi:MAG TPA: sigma-70 family RNA polymerase sigma factor [Blastocatellia bacterium]|nr:sigma-70 family RNA polymerase sigma factor [Blastocatellia bacterium]